MPRLRAAFAAVLLARIAHQIKTFTVLVLALADRTADLSLIIQQQVEHMAVTGLHGARKVAVLQAEVRAVTPIVRDHQHVLAKPGEVFAHLLNCFSRRPPDPIQALTKIDAVGLFVIPPSLGNLKQFRVPLRYSVCKGCVFSLPVLDFVFRHCVRRGEIEFAQIENEIDKCPREVLVLHVFRWATKNQPTVYQVTVSEWFVKPTCRQVAMNTKPLLDEGFRSRGRFLRLLFRYAIGACCLGSCSKQRRSSFSHVMGTWYLGE